MPAITVRLAVEAPKHLRHPGPADAEVTGESGPALELTGVQQRLVMAGEFQGIAAFFGSCRRLWFWIAGTVPGEDGDDGLST